MMGFDMNSLGEARMLEGRGAKMKVGCWLGWRRVCCGVAEESRSEEKEKGQAPTADGARCGRRQSRSLSQAARVGFRSWPMDSWGGAPMFLEI
jgi:hypothetical protein